MAEGNVCVSPGMFEIKVIVAPNSPMALAKERIIPAMMPGRIRGRVTTRKTRGGDAPSVPAASSNLRSTARRNGHVGRVGGDAMLALTQNGVDAVDPVDGGAAGPGLALVAGGRRVVEVVAAGALLEIAARGGAMLRSCGVAPARIALDRSG